MKRRRGTYYVHDRYLGDFLDFPTLHSAARFADNRFGCKPAADCVYIRNDDALVPIGSLRHSRNPLPNEHAARLISPSNVVPGSYRRKNVKGGSIGLLFAQVRGAGNGPRGGSMKLASVRFRAAHFTPAQAKEWMREHGLRPILFEAATNAGKAAWRSEGTRRKRSAAPRRSRRSA